ncbi:hypothetical protein IWQ62_005833 [Dispira parvispora]|uniref:Uncharacterized protein n=1 Tax=Dispira parvispora TaxID=1520584 RepID=A0A9W8APN6_9FUNG|nr:hypothetical protein IWQ62_005833 [Dispira parvispora]
MIRIINNQRYAKISAREQRRTLERVLALAGYPKWDLGVLFTGNTKIRGLNRQYRNKDKPTDILSFPFYTVATPSQLPTPRDDEERYLGDIRYRISNKQWPICLVVSVVARSDTSSHCVIYSRPILQRNDSFFQYVKELYLGVIILFVSPLNEDGNIYLPPPIVNSDNRRTYNDEGNLRASFNENAPIPAKAPAPTNLQGRQSPGKGGGGDPERSSGLAVGELPGTVI